MIPVGNRIILKLTKEEETGIIQVSDKKENREGIVYNAGNSDFNVGDKVKFKEFYDGEKIIYKNEEYLVINKDDIILILENND